MKRILDNFSPPEDAPKQNAEDLLRCGWDFHGKRCRLPGSIKPQGYSRHLCRWHARITLFSDPRFAQDEKAFNEWIESKRKGWVPVTGPDVWLRPNREIFRIVCGEKP